MSGEQPTHAEIYDTLEAMREDLRPLVEMTPDLKELVEVMRALRVGGKGLKWIASIATALLTIGGLILAMKAMAQSYWNAS